MKLVITICIGFLIISGCKNTPTQIERDNRYDPENSEFVLNPSSLLKTEILENKVIRLSWEDSSQVATGYVVTKSIDGSDNFTVLDTVLAPSTFYDDISQNVTIDTKYSTFSIRETQNRVINSDSLVTSIDFGNITLSNSNYNQDTTAVNINWEFSSKWPFIGVVNYFGPEVSDQVPIDTLTLGFLNYTSPSFETDFAERFYYIDFFVSETDLKSKKIFAEVNAGYFGGMEFSPENKSLQVINEGRVKLEWEDNSNFEDGFKVLRRKNLVHGSQETEIIATLPPNTVSYIDSLDPLIGYRFGRNPNIASEYGVLAFKKNTEAGFFGQKASIDINIQSFDIEVTNDNDLTLTWSFDKPELVSEIQILDSFDGTSFTTFKTIPGNATSYVISDLDTTKNHFYRIKTKTSRPSNIIEFNYLNVLSEEQFYNLPGVYPLNLSRDSKKGVLSKYQFSGESNWGIQIIDTETKTISNSIPDNDLRLAGSDIHSKTNKIGYYSYIDQAYYLRDYEQDTLIAKIENLFSFSGPIFSKFSRNGDDLYVMDGRSNLKKISLIDFDIIFEKPAFGPTSTYRELDISDTGDTIVYNYGDTFKMIDSLGNDLSFTPDINFRRLSNSIRFSKSGRYLSLVSDFNDGFIFDILSKSRLKELPNSNKIAINSKENLYAIAYRKELFIYSFNDDILIARKEFESQILELKFLSKDNSLFVSTESEGLYQLRLMSEKKWQSNKIEF